MDVDFWYRDAGPGPPPTTNLLHWGLAQLNAAALKGASGLHQPPCLLPFILFYSPLLSLNFFSHPRVKTYRTPHQPTPSRPTSSKFRRGCGQSQRSRRRRHSSSSGSSSSGGRYRRYRSATCLCNRCCRRRRRCDHPSCCSDHLCRSDACVRPGSCPVQPHQQQRRRCWEASSGCREGKQRSSIFYASPVQCGACRCCYPAHRPSAAQPALCNVECPRCLCRSDPGDAIVCASSTSVGECGGKPLYWKDLYQPPFLSRHQQLYHAIAFCRRCGRQRVGGRDRERLQQASWFRFERRCCYPAAL